MSLLFLLYRKIFAINTFDVIILLKLIVEKFYLREKYEINFVNFEGGNKDDFKKISDMVYNSFCFCRV